MIISAIPPDFQAALSYGMLAAYDFGMAVDAAYQTLGASLSGQNFSKPKDISINGIKASCFGGSADYSGMKVDVEVWVLKGTMPAMLWIYYMPGGKKYKKIVEGIIKSLKLL